jgi:hypothetical protein
MKSPEDMLDDLLSVWEKLSESDLHLVDSFYDQLDYGKELTENQMEKIREIWKKTNDQTKID